MSPRAGKWLFAEVLLAVGLLWLSAAPVRAATNGVAPTVRLPSGPPPLPQLTPPPALVRSPISFFRELLPMNAAELKQALTNRSPESQQRILAKVKEYRSLSPNECQLRLQVTELQWYLVPLLATPATNRAERLVNIPSSQRKAVEDRLREWDKLAPAEQKKLLENQATLVYLTGLEGLTQQQRQEMLKNIPPARRALLEQGIARWDAMSAEERRTMLDRFNQFFELTPEEKDKALRTLSGAERRQIEKTLKAFDSLPRAQRAACIRALGKYTRLSLEEREQFLKNAERWKEMTPAERQAWRDVVRTLPPPLPPPPLPPVPRHHTVRAFVTNGG